MRAPSFVLPLLLTLAACTTEGAFVPAPSPDGPLPAGEGGPGALQIFDDAASTWGVPSDLLRAIALAETGMQHLQGEAHDGRPPAAGLMALRGDRLVEAAALLGVSVDEVAAVPALNVAGAAALLSVWADDLGVAKDDLDAWGPVVARWSGTGDPEADASFVWDAVYAALDAGVALEGRPIKAHRVAPDWPRPTPRSFSGPNYAASVWRPSPNHDSRNSGAGGIGMVVIHSCEGAYSGCWSWLVNANSGVSAHYVVNERGTEVSQLVDEARRAWHVGATYDCGLNGNTDCFRSGWNVNHFSVGIEHAGYAAQASWDGGLLDTSAALVCDITRDRGIPRDSYHIVAHGRLQPYNRTDPGPNWPWTDYLNRVNTACGAPPPPPPPAGQFVIDSNNGANDTARRYIEVSGNWTSSVNVGGYYNTGYWVAPTGVSGDPARFWFLADSATCYDVDAWWTAASDRSTAAPFVMFDPTGAEIGRRTVDQTGGHSRWNRLGTWTFPAGWNQVALSRSSPAGAWVVADAVRLTPSSDPVACVTCATQDGDGDGVNDCDDACPADPSKGAPGVCGCGVSDADGDGDGVADCQDACPTDAVKAAPGVCGCGVSDADGDGDGVADCLDLCPTDPTAVDPGVCGCGMPDDDVTGDGVPDCVDCGDGAVVWPEGCDDGNLGDGDGCDATCQPEPLYMFAPTPGTAGAVNTFTAQGARPGAVTAFFVGRPGGALAVPGCPGVTLPLRQAWNVGMDAADALGVASVAFRVPAAGAGMQLHVVAVELDTCRVTPPVVERF